MFSMIILSVLCLSLLPRINFSQRCIGINGVEVVWWTALKVPPKINHTGYGYYDSSMNTGTYIYDSSKIDIGLTPLTETLQQINQMDLQRVAWNDQHPDGKTSSSLAHAKGLIAYSANNNKGFFLSHSLPKYPAFLNHQINVTIAPQENYYGQNLFCVSLSIDEIQKLSYNLLVIRPFVYQSMVKASSKNQYIMQLSESRFSKVQTLFTFYQINPQNQTKIKSIYKNNEINGSIFEDGLTGLLQKNMSVQSWGRPLQKAWCAKGYEVRNVITVKVGNIQWDQADDHSKWVVAPGVACFGDMNRMASQWKRGGAFFCIQDSSCSAALSKVVTKTDYC